MRPGAIPPRTAPPSRTGLRSRLERHAGRSCPGWSDARRGEAPEGDEPRSDYEGSCPVALRQYDPVGIPQLGALPPPARRLLPLRQVALRDEREHRLAHVPPWLGRNLGAVVAQQPQPSAEPARPKRTDRGRRGHPRVLSALFLRPHGRDAVPLERARPFRRVSGARRCARCAAAPVHREPRRRPLPGRARPARPD
jgi:hypothetical protein